MKSVPLLPKHLLSGLPSSSPVIDTGNYYPLRDGVITAIKSGMVESEWTSHVLGRPVVKAFERLVNRATQIRIRRDLGVLGQLTDLAAFQDLTGTQHVAANPLKRRTRCTQPLVSSVTKGGGALFDRLCRQIGFSLEMVVHAPLACARTLLNRLRTHTDVAPLPKKFLRALYQTLSRIHALYEVVRTKAHISKCIPSTPAIKF